MRYTSAYLRKDPKRGKWQAFLKYKNEEGKWRQVSKTLPDTVKTKKQAEKAMQEWRTEMELEASKPKKANLPNATTTVAEYVTAYIDTLERSGNIGKHTVSDYRGIAKRIAQAFPDVAMADLTTNMVQDWENRLTASGLAASTVIKIHRILAATYKHAVAVRDLDWNPCDAVKQPKRKAPSPNSLTAEGAARLAATLDIMEPSHLVTAAAIALHTGMREGEVCGLRWREYDEGSATIRVTESIGRAPGGDFSKEPKTKSSRRNVPVSPQLASILRRRRDAMESELQEAGVTLSAEDFGKLYVCGYADGRFYSPTMLSRQWRGLAESLGLRGTQARKITFHDLRHTFATRAIAAGAGIKAVASVLGHSTITITADVYADADEEAKRQAVALMGQGIAAQGDVRPYAELAPASE